MEHAQMRSLAMAFARCGIATLRFNFPFIEAGRKRVDPPVVAIAAIVAACAEARARTSLPLWLGGHSFGGRMASHAVLDPAFVPAPVGLIFCSFPLHPPREPATERARHLKDVRLPMLFLSGTRDALAERELLERVVRDLPTAKLHWLETADHGYHVQSRARGSEEDVFDELARVARSFIKAHPP